MLQISLVRGFARWSKPAACRRSAPRSALEETPPPLGYGIFHVCNARLADISVCFEAATLSGFRLPAPHAGTENDRAVRDAGLAVAARACTRPGVGRARPVAGDRPARQPDRVRRHPGRRGSRGASPSEDRGHRRQAGELRGVLDGAWATRAAAPSPLAHEGAGPRLPDRQAQRPRIPHSEPSPVQTPGVLCRRGRDGGVRAGPRRVSGLQGGALSLRNVPPLSEPPRERRSRLARRHASDRALLPGFARGRCRGARRGTEAGRHSGHRRARGEPGRDLTRRGAGKRLSPGWSGPATFRGSAASPQAASTPIPSSRSAIRASRAGGRSAGRCSWLLRSMAMWR